LKTYNKKE